MKLSTSQRFSTAVAQNMGGADGVSGEVSGGVVSVMFPFGRCGFFKSLQYILIREKWKVLYCTCIILAYIVMRNGME